MNQLELCDAIVAASRHLVLTGLNQAASGNISVRADTRVLITPSGIEPADLSADMIAELPCDATHVTGIGPHRPSSEWQLHLGILRARPDVGAIVHTHSPHATALSTLRRDIPAIHYMIAAFGGSRVRCTGYAPFGSTALADLAADGLGSSHAVLLGNHGMLVTGHDLSKAMWRAQELETLARLYTIALAAGEPVILSDAEIADAIERFKTYGRASTPPIGP